MKYSEGFKQRAVEEVMKDPERSVNEVANTINVYPATLSSWIKQAKKGTLSKDSSDAIPPSARHPGEKLTLLLQSKCIASENLGEWLRTNGLHSEHLSLWEQELTDIMANKANTSDDLKAQNSLLRKENKDLQRELARKEKALAEAAVLLTLKKKYQNLFEDPEAGI